jgi:hypothetical protein
VAQGNQFIVADSKDYYFAEGFKVDPATNKTIMPDTHSSRLHSVGADSLAVGPNMLKATTYVEHVDFMYGVGNYNNQQPSPDNGRITDPQATPLDVMKFNWQFGTGTYTVDWSFTDAGKWSFKDTSVGINASGTFNQVDPR